MRITADVLSAGKRWTFTFPKPPKLGEMLVDDGFDYAAALKHLRRFDHQIQWSSSDDQLVVAVALTFLDLVSQWKDDAADVDASKDERAQERIERHAHKGISTKVRVDFRRKRGEKVQMRISHANLCEAFQREDFEHCFAMILADLAVSLRKRIIRDGYGDVLELDAGTLALADEAEAIRSRADERDRIRKANEERLICERYRNGYCTPCKFDCPHCKGGVCVELEVK